MALITNVEFKENKSHWEIYPMGEMDIYTSNNFKDKVIEEYEKNPADMYLDAEELEYIDSTGLGALISLLKMTKENGHKIEIVNLKPNIRKLFDITQLDKMFIIRGKQNE